MADDPLHSEFVKHVRKYRPYSVTARLADEVERLRKTVIDTTAVIAEEVWPNEVERLFQLKEDP